jgi:hypothetical protein
MDPSQIGAVRAPKTTAHQPAHVFNKPTPYSRLSRVDRLKENGAIEDAPVSDDEEEADEEGESAGGRKRGGDEKEKMKMRGRNKSLKRFLRRKKKNVIDPTTVRPAVSSSLLSLGFSPLLARLLALRLDWTMALIYVLLFLPNNLFPLPLLSLVTLHLDRRSGEARS